MKFQDIVELKEQILKYNKYSKLFFRLMLLISAILIFLLSPLPVWVRQFLIELDISIYGFYYSMLPLILMISYLVVLAVLIFFGRKLPLLLGPDIYYHLNVLEDDYREYLRQEYKMGAIIINWCRVTYGRYNMSSIIFDLLLIFDKEGEINYEKLRKKSFKLSIKRLGIVNNVLKLKYESIRDDFKRKFTGIFQNN